MYMMGVQVYCGGGDDDDDDDGCADNDNEKLYSFCFLFLSSF
jgi:hypothetical protein